MPNPCGGVHMPSFPCRECDRVRSLKPAREKADDTGRLRDKVSPAVNAKDDSGRSSDELHGEALDSVPVPDSVASGSKSDRLAVAQEAAEETLKRYRAKAAARQKRYRKRRKSGE